MYQGYNLTIDKNFPNIINPTQVSQRVNGPSYQIDKFRRLIEDGKERQERHKRSILTSLEQFLSHSGKVDGDKILHEYFPTINAQVFISHSHDDVDLARALSQWLYENFKIEAFVDSNIWGSGEQLIKLLDNRYCLTQDGRHYQYEKRNLTTSFIHLILASAIQKMIDNCECFIFLNSPNSLSPNPTDSSTGSPWIYFELLQTQLIRRMKRQVQRRIFSSGGVLNEVRDFAVTMEAPLTELCKVNVESLKLWYRNCKGWSAENALDYLYENFHN